MHAHTQRSSRLSWKSAQWLPNHQGLGPLVRLGVTGPGAMQSHPSSCCVAIGAWQSNIAAMTANAQTGSATNSIVAPVRDSGSTTASHAIGHMRKQTLTAGGAMSTRLVIFKRDFMLTGLMGMAMGLMDMLTGLLGMMPAWALMGMLMSMLGRLRARKWSVLGPRVTRVMLDMF